MEKARKIVSKEVDATSFNKLVLRLSNKLLESLLLDINVNHTDAYSDWYRNRLDLRKKIMQAFTIKGRGLDREAFALYDKIIKRAKEYELYDELLEVLYLKQQDLGLRLGKKEFEKYLKEIKYYQRCKAAVYRAKNWRYRHFIEEVDNKGFKNEKLGLLTEAISDLQEEYRITKSANVGYYLYFLMMEYYMAYGYYKKSCETGLRLIELIESSPAIYMKRRLGHAYSDLADNELFIYDFDASLKHAKIAQNHYDPNEYDFEVAKEIEFKVHFYKGDIKRASDTINELLRNIQRENTPFQHDKRVYLKACVLFVQQKFKDSYKLLQKCIEIEQDQEGWNIGIRVLSILNLVEMVDLDFADARIEAMRKHIERIKELKPVRKRDIIILKILRQLEKESFDFKTVYKKCKKNFDKLESNREDYWWKVKSPEMIVFHKWFEAKVKNEPYQFSIPKKVIEQANKAPNKKSVVELKIMAELVV